MPPVLKFTTVLAAFPVPVPDTVRDCGRGSVNVALAFRAWSSVSVQGGDVPLHAPPHPPNVCPPLAGAAVSETCVPYANDAEHAPLLVPAVSVQEIPAGDEVTVPFPVPAPDIVRV